MKHLQFCYVEDWLLVRFVVRGSQMAASSAVLGVPSTDVHNSFCKGNSSLSHARAAIC